MSTGADPGPAVAVLRERVPGLLAVYRFGSAGTAFERRDSDLDLAVLTSPPLGEAARCTLRWETAEAVARVAGCDVDLLDLGSASTVFRARIVVEGTRLWCADRPFAERFEDAAMSAYARLNEERAGILSDIHARGYIRG